MAAAAYRSGEKLVNEWDGMTHDYTRKPDVKGSADLDEYDYGDGDAPDDGPESGEDE